MRASLASLGRWLRGGWRVEVPQGRWVVVDTETSGLDPHGDRLLSIGAIAVDGEGIRIADSFEVILGGAAAGDAANIVVHGIGHGAQAQGVPPAVALAAFADWSADAPRIGYHADFDRAVLRNATTGAGTPVDDSRWLDLAPLAAALAPNTGARGVHSLDDWLAVFGIECPLRHNAASDALATAELLLLLRALAAKQGARGFDALLKVAGQRKWLGGSGH